MTTLTTTVDDLLLRAAAYQVLAVGYGYPDATQQLRLDGLIEDLVRAGTEVDASWAAGFEPLRRARSAGGDVEIEAEFNQLFSGEITCAPHESAYEPDIFRRQRSLADIAGFHSAFGFELPENSRWQPDHIGVELELCALLLQRQAQAEAEGWEPQATVCDDALRAFLDDHLGRWYAAFCRRLGSLASTPFYRELARVTDAWVRRELVRWQLDPEPLADRPRSAEDDAPPACGGCPATPSTS